MTQVVKNSIINKAVTFNGTAYYFLKNLQGDVIALTNADGEVVIAILGEEATAFNIFAYCKNNIINHVDFGGYVYVSYKTLDKLFNKFSNFTRATKSHIPVWQILKNLAMPYILTFFSWVFALPVIGQVIFILVAASLATFAAKIALAYKVDKKGVDITVKWKWFIPRLVVTAR